METKHTKEYAQKLADKRVADIRPSDWRDGLRWGYVEGYMEAIKQTAAPDLLKAVMLLMRDNECQQMIDEAVKAGREAIKKATE